MSKNNLKDEIKEEDLYKYKSEDELVLSIGKDQKNQTSIFYEILKKLKPGVEIYKISMPSFLLSPVSFLEKISTNCCPNSIVSNLNDEKGTAQIRMAKITAWVISVWRNINKTGFAHSKPYNPGLGELFKCSWEHEEDNSVTYYMAEQVSHHPPISAYYSYNKKRKLVFEGFLEPKTSFSINNATTSITGRNSITLQSFKERYNIKYANVVAKSIFLGYK